MVRLWQPRETRLLSEWVNYEFPNDIVKYRVRLGQYPYWAIEAIEKGAPPAIYKNYQRWADAIIIRDKDLVLVEAKILSDPGVISQINLYARLIPKTPDLQQYINLPIRKVILMALIDREVESLAHDEGIEVYVFTPDWVTKYLIEIHKYKNRY